ncbi:MAG: hypothetical protein IT243_06145 [Bacteroidia bacterium]|nr:hypothetical protein [Bacteroidia bacterium]
MNESIQRIDLPYENLIQNFIWYADKCLEGGFIDNGNPLLLKDIIKAFEDKQSIWICGSNGTGKSMIFEILKRIVHPQSELRFRNRNVLDTVLDFNLRGHECFRDDDKLNVLYDDLGTEDIGYRYGEKVEVFEKLLQFRYDKWRNEGLRTFITTNLTFDEIMKRYGSRCRDRIREQFVQIILTGESKRRLKNFKGFPSINHKTILSKEDAEWKKNYQAHKLKCMNNKQVIPNSKTLGQKLRESLDSLIVMNNKT